MKEFRLEKKITSCLVTKNFIEEIENYLLNQLPEIVGIPREKIIEEYHLLIKDKSGTEIIRSISDFGSSLFHDTTNSVRISLSIFRPKKLYIDLSFSTDGYGKKIEIKYSASNPREIVIGIYESIKKIIDSKKNVNKIFNPAAGFTICMMVFVISSFFMDSLFSSTYWRLIYFGTLLMLLMTYEVACLLNKYISFESNSYFKKKKLSNWFFGGFLTFLVFEIIFVFLRQKILGF